MGFFDDLRNAGSQFKSDFDYMTGKKTFNPTEQKDYDARTEQSRIKLEERTGIGGGVTSSGSGAELTDAIRAAGVDRKAWNTMSDADKRDAMKDNSRLRDAFSRHNSSRGFDFDGSGSGSGGGGDDITSPADMYAENKRRYDEYMANKAKADRRSQEMDQARRIYEMRNMGAGRVPPQMQGIGGFYRKGRGGNNFLQNMMAQRQGGMGSRPPMPGQGGSGVQRGLGMPQMPGQGGSGVQRDINKPSAARARELMLAGDPTAAMRMLKASTGMEDTSLSSQDALNYYQNSGDQAGAQNILRSSVGLPQQQVARQGVMPPYNYRMPMPQPMPQNQATSPAFRYAAQNYGRLGGQQRMYDRPMEMMSQRERQGVRDVRDNMNRIYPMQRQGPQYSQQPQYNQQQGIAQLLQNALANKGGGRTAPQPQMPRYQTMPYQVGQGGLPSIGGKGAGRTMPQDRGMRGFGGDPRFQGSMQRR